MFKRKSGDVKVEISIASYIANELCISHTFGEWLFLVEPTRCSQPFPKWKGLIEAPYAPRSCDHSRRTGKPVTSVEFKLGMNELEKAGMES